MSVSLLHRLRKMHKNPRIGRKCVAFWVPEARKVALYNRARQENKTVQTLLNELVRNYLEGRII